jgi:hypothetical protein
MMKRPLHRLQTLLPPEETICRAHARRFLLPSRVMFSVAPIEPLRLNDLKKIQPLCFKEIMLVFL